MDNEIIIEFTPEMLEDIKNQEIAKNTIDLILNYEEGVIKMNNLIEMEQMFLEDEFYNMCESVKRAKKVINIIFE